MPIYIVTAKDFPSSGPIRQDNRAGHLRYCEQSHAAGRLLLGAALIEGGNVVGSAFIIRAPSFEEATRQFNDDPFSKSSVWSEASISEMRIGDLFGSTINFGSHPQDDDK